MSFERQMCQEDHATVAVSSAITIVYPQFRILSNSIRQIPLSARALLIKQCQAQAVFVSEDPSCTLYKMMNNHPPLVLSGRDEYGVLVFTSIPVFEFFTFHDVTPGDPLISTILLDLLRACEVESSDAESTRVKGWCKEIRLALHRRAIPCVNFHPFFFRTTDPVHPNLPVNRQACYRIRECFEQYRFKLIRNRPVLYARATHKNMSRDTRREFEDTFSTTLEGEPIFGQDDWQRVYHETGVMLGGVVELRQKWYASGAKPRTYAAMGGLAYQECRFLQDFFTDLVNCLPPTNHVTRLQPERLRAETLTYGDTPSFLVYDLEAFTSSMVEQKNLCKELIAFFEDVDVIIVDERYGPLETTLGYLLCRYLEFCVESPRMSLERSPASLGVQDERDIEHATASLLGIFGNLMSCTLGHYLIVAPCTESFNEVNVAGDDGILPRGVRETAVHAAVSLVGVYEKEKCFDTMEYAAIALKRPIVQLHDQLIHSHNIVAPTLVTMIAYLSGNVPDSRYTVYNLDELDWEDRVSIAGTDLLRFLRSCWIRKHEDFETILAVYSGYTKLMNRCKKSTKALRRKHEGRWIFWPLNPSSYEFYDIDPLLAFLQFVVDVENTALREIIESDESLEEPGDTTRCNSSPRLVLLERLGYVEKSAVRVSVEGYQAVEYFYVLFTRSRRLPPIVYEYVCIKEIPYHFRYSDSQL